MNDLKKYSNLAQNILNQKTRYKSNKEIISSVFKIQHVDKIMFRLTIIDSYFSTQMSKRLYGLEDIALALGNFKDDEELRKEASKFLTNPKEGKIKDLFKASYGFDKQAKNKKRAISLLSKYLYFLLDYQFPIYDTLAKMSYTSLVSNNYLSSKALSDDNYFELMIALNQSTTINNFEKLDNLLWLLGKLESGSFSILMDKLKYETIVKQVDFGKAVKSQDKDKAIRDYIENNYQSSNLFSSIEKEFFDFAFSLH